MKYLDNVVYNDESLQIRDVVARDQTTQLNTQLVETQTQVQSHDREITTLKSQMMGAQGDIEFLENRVTQCEEDIVSLDSSVGHLEQETSSLNSRVTTLENATSGLSQLETAVSQNTSEIGQLWDSVDIINNVNADQSTAINSLQTNQSEIQTHLSEIDDTIDDLDDRITASTYEAGIGIYFGQGQEHTNINLEDEVLDKLAEIDTKTSITDSNDTLHTELKLSDDFKIENGVVYPDAKFIQLDAYGPVNPTHIKSVFDYVFNDLIDFQVGDIKTRHVYLENAGNFYKISGFGGSLASDSSTRKLSFLASVNDKVYTHNIIEHFDGTNYSYTDEGIGYKECIVLNSAASIKKAYQIIDADYDSSEQTVSHRFTPSAQFLLSASITSITYDNDSYIVAPATIDVVLGIPMVYRAHALVYVQNSVTGYNFYELSVDITENPSTVSYTWTPIQMGGGGGVTTEAFVLQYGTTGYTMDSTEQQRLISWVSQHKVQDTTLGYKLDAPIEFIATNSTTYSRYKSIAYTQITATNATFTLITDLSKASWSTIPSPTLPDPKCVVIDVTASTVTITTKNKDTALHVLLDINPGTGQFQLSNTAISQLTDYFINHRVTLPGGTGGYIYDMPVYFYSADANDVTTAFKTGTIINHDSASYIYVDIAPSSFNQQGIKITVNSFTASITDILPAVDDPYIQQISHEPYQVIPNGNLAQLYKPGIYRNSATSAGGRIISNGPTPLNGTAPECIIEVINTGTTLPSGRGDMLIQKIYTDGVIYIRHRQYNYTTNAMEWKDWYSYTGTVVT